MTQRRRVATWVMALVLLSACERAPGGPAGVDERKLRLVVENLSTIRGWAVTDSTAERLAWLAKNAAWDVDGTVTMLRSAHELAAGGEPSAQLEEMLGSGVTELENATPEMIGGRIRGLEKRLGSGNCTVIAAPAAEVERAKQRLATAPPPPGLSDQLTGRIDRLRARAGRVGSFFHASCEGPSPILFGWIDDVPVPLFDLFED